MHHDDARRAPVDLSQPVRLARGTGRVPRTWAGYATRPVVPVPRLRARLVAAARAARDGLAVDDTLDALLLDVFDAAGERGDRGRRAPAAGDPRIRAVVDHLRGELSRRVPVRQLAEHAGLSREELIRGFRRTTGHPPGAWHLQARLAEGRRLLRSGMPIAEVAARTGFADQAHFTRRFRAAYAVTPGAFVSHE